MANIEPDSGWPLLTDWCPVDVHFNEYLDRTGVTGKSIFHFGTGKHHVVGEENVTSGRYNEILGLTRTSGEVLSYVRLVEDRPEVERYYRVMYLDVYKLTERALPDFDIVALFHLCEFVDEKDPHVRLSPDGVLDLFLRKLNPGGTIMFYKGSDHFEQAGRVIARFEKAGRIVKTDEYKSILVYAPA